MPSAVEGIFLLASYAVIGVQRGLCAIAAPTTEMRSVYSLNETANPFRPRLCSLPPSRRCVF
ncbi:MAG: hypothetical protein ICV81_12590 [Flavisolibacter sp.]|nr:hypothetical protein [Flavisolibacter sp.]